MALQVALLREEKVLLGNGTRWQSEAAPRGAVPAQDAALKLGPGRPGVPRGGEELWRSALPTEGAVAVCLCGHGVMARCDRRSPWPVRSARVP